MLRPFRFGTSALRRNPLQRTRVIAPPLPSKLVEQPQRSTSPKVGLSAEVILGELRPFVQEPMQTRGYTVDRIRSSVHAARL